MKNDELNPGFDEENQFEEEEIFRDKIFDNNFESTESEKSSTNFSLDLSKRERPIDENVDKQIVFDKVKVFVEDGEEFKKFHSRDSEGNLPKINKSNINEIYSTVCIKFDKFPKIEIFDSLTEFFDVSPEKFYESLSNTFKTELIIELRNRGYLKPRKPLF
jgi:hypothetical protein